VALLGLYLMRIDKWRRIIFPKGITWVKKTAYCEEDLTPFASASQRDPLGKAPSPQGEGDGEARG